MMMYFQVLQLQKLGWPEKLMKDFNSVSAVDGSSAVKVFEWQAFIQPWKCRVFHRKFQDSSKVFMYQF